MKRYIILSLAIVLFAFNAQAADRLGYENFDDQNAENNGFHETEGEVSPSWVTGRGGSGYAMSYYSNVGGEPDMAMCFNTPGGLDQIYVSYWMKLTNTGGTTDEYNNKLVYWYPLNSSQGLGAYTHNWWTGYFLFAIGYDWAGGVALGDGNWHNIEFWADENGGVKVGLDRHIHGWSEEQTNSRTSTWEFSNGRMCFPSIVGHNASWSANRVVDDLEIWDGMPDGSIPDPNPAPIVTISSPDCPVVIGEEPNTVLGQTSIGGMISTTDTNDTKCLRVTTTNTTTVTHGWWYASTQGVGTGTFQLGIWTDSNGPGSLVGSCSTSDPDNLPADGSEAWNEVTFSPAVTLSPNTTYHICYYTEDDYEYWYNTTGGVEYGEVDMTGCTEQPNDGSGTSELAIAVGNYDAL